MAVHSGHIGCWFDAHFIYSLNLLLIITTILSELPLIHRGASYTHKKMIKNTQFFAKVHPWDAGKLGLAGPTQKFVIVMVCPSSPYFVTRWVMSIHKSLFDIVRPSTLRKPEKRKPESDADQGDDTQVKKHKLCPKWLGEFHWLKYDSTEKQMKCKVCLDAYGWKPNASQNFLHGANNLHLILASLLNTITSKFL